MTRERDRIQENANNSYIIRNCPCIKHYDDIEFDNRCMSTQNDKVFFCENNTDCVIKQVIEKCKAKKLDIFNPSIGNEHYALANSVLSTQILQLFDIEEINK